MKINESIEQIMEQIDIEGPAPEQEPYRQYYFIKKARKYVKALSEKLGRPLYACTVTFGCQMRTGTQI